MSVLTVDRLYEAYDTLYRFPQETHWYICHPDDLDRLRAVHAPERWGTCPMIHAHSSAEPGKVLQIKYQTDPAWQWPWQRM
jgi:hypothetical protein